MGALIRSTVPVPVSLDLDESAAFHQDRLGFAARLRAPDYLIVQRDGCALHLWACNERHIAEDISCYARGDTQHALHADFARRSRSGRAACARCTPSTRTATCSSSANRRMGS
jgi:hypothetical protein